MALHLVKRRVCVGDCEKGEVMAAENVPCSGGCGKVRSILHGDSPKQWLCYTCAQKKKPATDRAALHRALDAGMNIAPKVTRDATICNRCGQIVRCNFGYFKPHSIPGPDNGQTCSGSGKVVGTEGGNGSKWWAKDRASLHRALDAVLDGARAKDAARFTVGQHVSIRGGKSFGTITAVLPYPGNKTGKLMYEVLQDGQRKSQPLEYFKESELQNT